MRANSYVDKVWSRLSLRPFARKRFPKGRDSAHARVNRERLIQELTVLKRISRQDAAHHLVTLRGSYTDEKCIGLLMEPVADMDLMQFLETASSHPEHFEDERTLLRSYYGCLASAVRFLHGHHIRHRDLKPQNILIHQRQIYLADFGEALDWSRKDQSITQDQAVRYTEFYRAPECSQGQRRGSATDMWSLGVIFLEMTTVLRGKRVEDFARALRLPEFQNRKLLLTNSLGKEPYPYSNQEAVMKWLTRLQSEVAAPLEILSRRLGLNPFSRDNQNIDQMLAFC